MDEAWETQVRLAILVPIYGHVSLAMEALSSTLDQAIDGDVHRVCVVDGDPDPNLARLLTSFAARQAHRCSVYWRRNGGLSAARNTAIAIALARFPALQAVFFLDADNRLAANALGEAFRRIVSDDADVLYPNLANFGLRSSQDTAGRFSLAALLRGNYIEAGSLVATRVLRAGLRFDETLREGYEDWAFWLDVARAGFRFAHEPSLGLLYRRRPESMLANTHRRSMQLRSTIEAAHPNFFALNARRRIAVRDEPAYALVHVDDDRVQFSGDLGRSAERIGIAECGRRIHLHVAAPTWTHCPAWFVFAESQVIEALRTTGLLPGLVWRLAASAALATCHVQPRSGRGYALLNGSAGDAHVLVASRAALVAALQSPEGFPRAQAGFELTASEGFPVGVGCIEATADAIVQAWSAMPLAASAKIRWSERDPVASRLPVEAPDDVFPALSDGRRHVGLVHQAAGDTAELSRLAVLLAEAGLTPHLFSRGAIIPGLCDFETTTLIPAATRPVPSQAIPDSVYFGAALDRGDRRLLSALQWLDVLVVGDVADILPLLGDLRASGTMIVVAWDRSLFQSTEGLQSDSDILYRLAAYEHAIEVFFVDQEGAVRLTALGVPRCKIIAREMPQALVAEIARRRGATARKLGENA